MQEQSRTAPTAPAPRRSDALPALPPARTDTAPPAPPELGAAVRAARTAAGLTLAEVSARTRVRVPVLEDLEAGSSARSGGAAYARGHLKAIAAATGADPAVLLAAHDRSVGPAVPAPGSPTALPPTTVADLRLPAPARERGGPRWGLAGAAALLVLAVLLLVGTLGGGDRAQPVSAPTATVPTSAPAAPPVAAPPATPAGAALRLAVSGTGSWVQVQDASGAALFAGTLPAGTVRDFRDPAGLRVVVGNAGAVTLDCGSDSLPPGTRGQVLRLTCAPDGLVPA